MDRNGMGRRLPLRALIVLLGPLAAVAIGLALFEVTMQPASGERLQLALVFAATAVLAALAAWWLPRRAARFRSLHLTIVVLGVASVLLGGLGAAVAAGLMFISGHDLNLVLVTLGFGALVGVVFAVTVARPLTDDLARMGSAADRIAAGDLGARTGVRRPDEVGVAAAAMDDMARRLGEADAARVQEEQARRHFLAAVGHDLRTPLAALQAAVEALQDGVAPDPERYLRSMRQDLRVLAGLVDDLFMLSRLEAGELQPERTVVDLAEVADEAIEAMHPVARTRGVQVRLENDGGVLTFGGPEALGRVIRNLVDNAIRHAPGDTEVVVQVANGSGAVVRVVDAGPGFPPDLVDRAFDSFVRGDPARARHTGGAGLGLAIARGLVEAHGGEIWAEAGPGGRVAFRLPSAGTV